MKSALVSAATILSSLSQPSSPAAFCDTYIYLVRHGETTANRAKIRQGHTDYPLTDEGVLGALSVGNLLKDIHFDTILSSDLGRALKTCELIVSKSSTRKTEDISTLSLLREINFGIREGLHVDTTFDQAKAILAKERGVSPDAVDTLAETDASLEQRHRALMALLKEKCTKPKQNVLCVTHGGFIRTLLRTLLPSMEEEKIENCSITVLRVMWEGENELVVMEPGYYNFVKHLLLDSCATTIGLPHF